MRKHAVVIAPSISLVVFAAALAAQTRTPKTHRLEATPSTVAYGYYWAEARPVLRIASGDIIDVDTLLTNNPTGLQRAGVSPEKIQDSLKAIVAEVTGDRRGPGGHILTGPVYVEGAEPGDVLEVKILSIDFAIDYGYNGCSGFIPENCDRAVGLRIMPIDRKTMTAEYAPGIVIPLRPFFGSMGVAPAPELGRVSSNPPGRHAGNLDNRELVAGSTLYIPVFVPGALFEIGDGHAAQGDGEVGGTAIECPMTTEAVVSLAPGRPLGTVHAEAPAGRITFGFDADLNVAMGDALDAMVSWMQVLSGVGKATALALASTCVDLRITQVANQTWGVHAVLPAWAMGGAASAPNGP